MNRRKNLVLALVFGALALQLSPLLDSAGGASAQSAPVSPSRRVVDPYTPRNHVITFNIRGGAGDATAGFNSSATAYNGTNTVQSRIEMRWPYAYAVGLQEVCESNYNNIVYELAVDGYTGGSGYSYKFVQSLNNAGLGTRPPSTTCGAWFGNAIFVLGPMSIQAGDRYPASIQKPVNPSPSAANERRSWVCGGNTHVFCTTHLNAGGDSYTISQSSHYRGIGGLYVGQGQSTLASGDLNLEPGAETLNWAAAGWRDVDQHAGGFQTTTTNGLVIDYIWKKNPASWWSEPYLGSASWTDHYLKQGYF